MTESSLRGANEFLQGKRADADFTEPPEEKLKNTSAYSRLMINMPQYAKCPKCGATVRVETAGGFGYGNCPNCGARVSCSETWHEG